MFDFQCNNDKCRHVEQAYIGPNFKDEIPEKCPKCGEGKMEKQFPDCSKVGIDVIGGYEYQYGKKNWRKGKSAIEQAGYLVKGDDGTYKNPY